MVYIVGNPHHTPHFAVSYCCRRRRSRAPQATDENWACECGACPLGMQLFLRVCCCSQKHYSKLIGDNRRGMCVTALPAFQDLVRMDVKMRVTADLFDMESGLERPADENRRMRYLCYRLANIWLRGPSKYRKPLPACVCAKIRQVYPSESYTGFRFD